MSSLVLKGVPIDRKNRISDFTAHLLHEVCHNVALEPHLQPIKEKFFGCHCFYSRWHAPMHLDIAAGGVGWSQFVRTSFEVRVFHPYAP